MSTALVLGAGGLFMLLCVEGLRWTFRPEARRLRLIRKIGGRR